MTPEGVDPGGEEASATPAGADPGGEEPPAAPASVDPEGEETPATPTGALDRLRYLRKPGTWLAGILLTVAGVTFQDVLTSTAKTVLSLDSLPDRLSPQSAVEVVEVRNVKDTGDFLVRDDTDGRFAAVLDSDQSWWQKAGIVDVGQSAWMVTLRGRATQQVRITDIVPELEGGTCAPPLSGSLVHAPAQGAADVIPLGMTIDAPVPKMTVTAEGVGSHPEPYFTGAKAKTITLDRNESEAFVITAQANSAYCRWRYRIHYQVDGAAADMVLGRPDGKPFELTAELPDAGRYPSVYFRSFLCGNGGYTPRQWFTATGKAYATSKAYATQHGGTGVPCTDHH
ncbi:hypothetical protein GCM10009760_37310 [Kitasatospora kazusensis]|uniref:Uncharacterized protein n=1 Tax=Kitasatospora kazusensis TaxID=407974 RepID=A0ABP5LL86_9ACTN